MFSSKSKYGWKTMWIQLSTLHAEKQFDNPAAITAKSIIRFLNKDFNVALWLDDPVDRRVVLIVSMNWYVRLQIVLDCRITGHYRVISVFKPLTTSHFYKRSQCPLPWFHVRSGLRAVMVLFPEWLIAKQRAPFSAKSKLLCKSFASQRQFTETRQVILPATWKSKNVWCSTSPSVSDGPHQLCRQTDVCARGERGLLETLIMRLFALLSWAASRDQVSRQPAKTWFDRSAHSIYSTLPVQRWAT